MGVCFNSFLGVISFHRKVSVGCNNTCPCCDCEGFPESFVCGADGKVYLNLCELQCA